MTVVAPPRPPQPTVDRDDPEALIEEARRRARRRRLVVAAAAATVAVAGVSLFAVLGGDESSTTALSEPSGRSVLAAASASAKIAFISGARRCPTCTGAAPDRLPGVDGAGALYVMNADGSEQRLVTRNVSPGAGWSPDGRKFAFNRRGGPGIHVINADGSGERRLTRSGWGAAWSPDGRKLAFSQFTRKIVKKPNRWRISEINEISVMNADGSGRRKLTHGGRDLFQAWLPDGTIAFFRHTQTRPLSVELYVMNADGSRLRNLTREWRLDGFPAWSPDAERIAFVTERGGNAELYVVNADGSGERRLTRSAAQDGSPAWSPDGQRIAFVRSSGHTRGRYRSDIYVVDADGSGERRLTERGARPQWSPDGRMIAFVSERDGNPELYVMNADGSGQRRLTRTPTKSEGHFTWSP